MKEYFGNYVGLVIQNNDPERAGKVKVFVPHLTGTVYKKWVENKTNKRFNFPGSNIYSALTQTLSGGDTGDANVTSIIQELKNILPWALCAGPLTSENASGRYNAYNSFANISDSNFNSTFTLSTSSAQDTPGKPGAFYEKDENRLSDAFVSAGDNINRPNPLSYEYIPSTYSNRAKGAFGVPSVGSHVWVFFREGNPTQPVYFATAFGEIDWRGIFQSYNSPGIDYPSSFENSLSANTDYNSNVETYRNKYVINQKGGAIEITSTDLKESVKLTHFSGSFKEFNNQANIELATGNDQKLVLNDQYSTVRGFKNEFTNKNHDEIILRDKYKKIGSLNASAFQQWKAVVAPIQDNKQLFEIQRALPNNVVDNAGNIAIKRNSLMQTRVGTFAPHPVLQGTDTYYSLTNDSIEVSKRYIPVSSKSLDGPALLKVRSMPGTVKPLFSPSAVDATRYQGESGVVWGAGGLGASTSSQNGIWAPDIRKDLIKTLMEASMKQLAEIESTLGVGGSEIIQITKHKVETIGMEINDFGSIRYDKIGKMLTSEVLIDPAGTYIDYKESPLVEYTHVQDLPGGTYTLNVCNRYNVLVGAGGLNLKSLGPTNITGTITNIVGEQVNISSENEVNLDAHTINISAEILRLRNKNQRQILIEHSLGVNNNVIIGGALSVEGEVFLQHITAPTEYQVTQQTKVLGKLLSGLKFNANIAGVMPGSGVANVTITLSTDSSDDKVQCYDHSHVFKNIPLTLHDTNIAVRTAAGKLNKNVNRVHATERYHKKK